MGLIAVLAFALLAAPTDAGAKRRLALNAKGSAEQVYVTKARPGEKLRLVRDGQKVATTEAGSLGGGLFREIGPGSGYRVRGDGRRRSDPVRVLKDRTAPPDTGIYKQELPESGYGYLRTRDGTKLAISVRKPDGQGPFPTLVEYSGYGYARPSSAQSGISDIATLLGFAVVDVNMRGTGCSGGAFDYFERLQSLDGYDVIETVAKQPWTLEKRVGMVGVSYGGLSQLFVGATNPPHLAGITPLSVIDDPAATLYPGGMLNTGFALAWAEDRDADAQPATETTGQDWAYDRIQEGDEVCEANQTLHTEATNLVQKVHDNQDYVPEVADPLTPSKFVDKIDVPVFLACQWNDEQTGAHCPRIARNFTGTDKKWFTFTNGLHIDALDPETFNRWYDFLQLYIARQRPALDPIVTDVIAPQVYQAAMGIPGVTLPDDPIQDEPTYEEALAAFEAQPAVRVLFDSGAGKLAQPGAPYPGFEQSYESFPIPACSPSPTPPCTQARSWNLADGEELTDTAPAAEGTESFTWDMTARPATNFTGDTGSGGLWGALPDYNWQQVDDTNAASYMTDELTEDVGIVGAGALEAWVKSSEPDVDLQVTVSEVRPDGDETYVQSGWLRASRRALDPLQSTELEPVPSFLAAERADMPDGQFAKLTIPLYYQGHVYRAGSQIRVSITAPTGDQPVWSFDDTVPEESTADIEIAHSAEMPSRLVLPQINGLDAPTDLPPCPSLRGEPCREFATP